MNHCARRSAADADWNSVAQNSKSAATVHNSAHRHHFYSTIMCSLSIHVRQIHGPNLFLLDNVYRQPAMNERVPIRADYRMLVNDYDEEKALISPEELCSEDQHLVTHVVYGVDGVHCFQGIHS
ncbi:hypothetical protein PsorP6_016174 [Peronosclerospora sorghi]|uniref:Uncharacterized protein n=1 Tax=Peronosclerospora sorghi TaxID=230839 RepID=A0ACC0VMY9_9STRA|nr:hypothetical protein PsorP6_016174 [Peronosclerospora sorghi]